MKKSEAYKLMAMAQAAHPSYQDKDLNATVEAWYVLLKDISFELAEQAMRQVLQTSEFFPRVAELRRAAGQIVQQQNPTGLPTPEMAWAEVLKEIRRVGYLGTPQWTHAAVGEAADALYGNWTRLCQNLRHDNETVERAHYYRIYQSMTEPERLRQQLGQLPQTATRLLEGGDPL